MDFRNWIKQKYGTITHEESIILRHYTERHLATDISSDEMFPVVLDYQAIRKHVSDQIRTGRWESNGFRLTSDQILADEDEVLGILAKTWNEYQQEKGDL